MLTVKLVTHDANWRYVRNDILVMGYHTQVKHNQVRINSRFDK